MAFPTTSVLDDFNRADAGTLGANWTNDIFGVGSVSFSIASNKASTTVGGYEWFSQQTFGPDCETYITLGTTLDTFFDGEVNIDSSFNLYTRLQTPGSNATDGYFCITYPPGAAGGFLVRMDNGVGTTLGAQFTCDGNAGDKIGIEAVGSTLTVYRKPAAGAWGSLAVRTDGTYSTGYLGIAILASGSGIAYTLDDFGGGTIGDAPAVAQSTTVPFQNVLVGSRFGW